jgi:hypothetical protein
MSGGTVLLVVTTNAADAEAMAGWLAPHLAAGEVAVVSGYFAAVSALGSGHRAVVAEIGVPSGREDWRLAELRSRVPDAAVVVVADAVHVRELARPLRADLAVTSLRNLPPLRELLLSDEPVVADPPAARPTRRDEPTRS